MPDRNKMTDREVAIKFDKLCTAYHKHWLVKDTKAFEDFCFTHSERIAKLLLKGTEQ